MRKLFTDPESLKPGQTTEAITQEVAERFSELADGMRIRRVPAQKAAHFLMKLMFCMFAEDIELLPHELFTKLLNGAKHDPARLSKLLAGLFEAMRTGGDFGADSVLYFNGGLFADAEVVDLTPAEIAQLMRTNECDWSNVEPSIFGTLFERTLDPAKRSQIGAHYTSKEDILTLLEPVVMAPLRREWEDVKAKCEKLWPKIQESARQTAGRRGGKASKPRQQHDHLLLDFVQRLAHVTVLDPACGSGNFLYVAINLLLDLEKEVIAYAANRGTSVTPHVSPTQLAGIEINPYAQQLAQVVIWIGHLQWKHQNGFAPPRNPVLEPIENIRLMDAIIDLSDPEHPKEPEWPEAEFIVGNPPFLGNKRMRSELGAEYTGALWELYADRLPAMSDICCYWFETARHMIETSKCRRAGLLATTGIKQVGARRVLERISASSSIFFAISEREWILEGASVYISIIGFASKEDSNGSIILDGKEVQRINADLTAGLDLTESKLLPANAGLCFMGITKVGDFDIDHATALQFLTFTNPNGRPNSDVVRPLRNGSDLVRVCSHRWIIDFGVSMPIADAALYEAPFEYVVAHVKAERQKNGRQSYRENWWIHGEARPGFRDAVGHLPRYVATARVAKHRLFLWLDTVTLPDSKVIAVVFSDDFNLGVLHSRIHEIWTRGKCGWHGGERQTYNPTACFETFPFPQPTDKQREAIAEAAKELDRLRNNWLNPPEWTREEVLEFPGSANGPWSRYVHDPNARGIGTVRYQRLVPKDELGAEALAARMLTNLYNERPTWLALAHQKLDEAVFAAYGWEPGMSDEEILAKLLELNVQRSA